MTIPITSDNKKNIIIRTFEKYIKWIISILIFAVLVAFIIFFLNMKQHKENIQISNNFNTARILLQNNKKSQSLKIFKEIVKKNNRFYSVLSLNLILDNELEKEKKEIDRLFKIIISNKKIDKENINLIKIKKALYLSTYGNEKDMLETLNPIVNSKSIWRTEAIKLLGSYYLQKKEYNKSEEYYKLLNNEFNN